MRKQFIRIYAGIAIVLLLSAFGFLAMSKQWVASVRQADFEDKTQVLIAMVREELEAVDVDPVAQLLVLNMFSLTHRMPITLEPLFVLPLSSAEKGRLKAGEVVTISIEERLQTYQMAPNGDVIVLGPYLLEEMIRWQDNLIEEGDGEGDGGNFFFQIDVLFFGILVAILLGIGGAIYFLIRPFERRIYALSDAAERFGRGDLSSRSPVGKGHAVADLARSFNGMADRIEGVVDGQRELLRAVSHELRTPLARIFFLLNQLKNNNVVEDHHTDIRRIERSVYELNDLVEELMDFARLDRDISHRTEIDVYAQMRELREMVAELRGDISVDIDSEHLMVWANETYFKRALTNLVTNAVRHARHHIWITAKKVDEMAHISVEDDGCGIPEHLREKVFEPFYRVDEDSKTGGTGLGLAIVKRIVMQNDGQVRVENRTEGGARFTLMFPLGEKIKTGRVDMKRYLIAILLMTAMLWCYSVAQAQEKQEASPPAFVDEDGNGIDDRVTFRHRQGLRSRGSALLWVLSAQLTKAQRATLQARINELIEGGAEFREIRMAIFAELEGFGVDLTETFLTRLNAVLTEDQMAALRKKAEALKANGATYYRIYREIRDELAVMGINWEGQRPDYSGPQLTEGEMSDLQKKIDRLIADGASRVEIQKAINAELEEIRRRNRRRSRAADDRGGPPPRPPERERSGKQGN